MKATCSQNDSMMDSMVNHEENDDIDADLTNLEESLEGSMLSSPGDITAIPELSDYIRYYK